MAVPWSYTICVFGRSQMSWNLFCMSILIFMHLCFNESFINGEGNRNSKCAHETQNTKYCNWSKVKWRFRKSNVVKLHYMNFTIYILKKLCSSDPKSGYFSWPHHYSFQCRWKLQKFGGHKEIEGLLTEKNLCGAHGPSVPRLLHPLHSTRPAFLQSQ